MTEELLPEAVELSTTVWWPHLLLDLVQTLALVAIAIALVVMA